MGDSSKKVRGRFAKEGLPEKVRRRGSVGEDPSEKVHRKRSTVEGPSEKVYRRRSDIEGLSEKKDVIGRGLEESGWKSGSDIM